MTAPVIFLAFANDADEHLDLLKTESRGVFTALSELDRKDFVKVHREESADLDAIVDRLVSYTNRVAIFHYGGHADGTTLRLEGGAAHAKGLAQLLGEEAQLKLVFLNGCATAVQVDGLMAAGVKAVIATTVKIRDDMATRFATTFYKALARDLTIERAFKTARGELAVRHADAPDGGIVPYRGIGTLDSSDRDRWALYVADAHKEQVLEWRLPYYRTVGLPAEMNDHIASVTTKNRYVMQVLDEMARYNPDIYTEMVTHRGPEVREKDSREYPPLIIGNLPWPVGSQVRLLWQPASPVERLDRLVSVYVRTSQLLYYVLLSDLWERLRNETIDVRPPISSGVPSDQRAFSSFDFLERTVALYRIFEQMKQTPYVKEFEHLSTAWDQPDGFLRQAHALLEELRTAPKGLTDWESEGRAEEAEQAVAIVLRAAAFLAGYKMLTIRSIAVDAQRTRKVAYELDLGPLNATDQDLLTLNDKRSSRDQYGNSHSIVLARDENRLEHCLNLSPFVIDKNTFVRVGRSEGLAGQRLAHVFVLSYLEGSRLVYLSVDHALSHALDKPGDRIHTEMTQEDFFEGRNLSVDVTTSKGGGRLSDAFSATAKGTDTKVFEVLRAQFEDFLAVTGAPR